jgi:hypothetical protein
LELVGQLVDGVGVETSQLPSAITVFDAGEIPAGTIARARMRFAGIVNGEARLHISLIR